MNKMVRMGLAAAVTAALAASAGAAWANVGHKDKAGGGGGGARATQARTITEIAATNRHFTVLNRALQATGLGEILSATPGPVTVFAPVDEAFAALPADALAMLMLPENKQLLTDLLRNHVVDGAVLTSDIRNGQLAQTMLGEAIAFEIVQPDQTAQMGGGGGQGTKPGKTDVKVKVGDATIIQSNVKVSNGIVQVIDRVLLPSNMPMDTAPSVP